MDLKNKKCVPCEGGVPPFNRKKIEEYMEEISPDWKTEGITKIIQEFQFKNFKEAMDFVNKVAKVAKEENHHPDIFIYYNKVIIELWTHAIEGLMENDFILAAKIDRI